MCANGESGTGIGFCVDAFIIEENSLPRASGSSLVCRENQGSLGVQEIVSVFCWQHSIGKADVQRSRLRVQRNRGTCFRFAIPASPCHPPGEAMRGIRRFSIRI